MPKLSAAAAAASALATVSVKEMGGSIQTFEGVPVAQLLSAFKGRLPARGLNARVRFYAISSAQAERFASYPAEERAFLAREDTVPESDFSNVRGDRCLLAVPQVPVAAAGAGAAAPEFANMTLAITELKTAAQELSKQASASVTVTKELSTQVCATATVTKELSEQVSATAIVTKELSEQVRALPQHIADRLAASEEGSVKSNKSVVYEDHARSQMPDLLRHHCGLVIPAGVDDFHRENFVGREWDYRAPVLVASEPVDATAISEKFVIFPSKSQYSQPPKPDPRQVTPTKFGTATTPPLAHYLAIFEFTTAPKWTKPYKKRPGLLVRLEERLQLTYERARAEDASISKITDIVAVVGVATPSPYTSSVRSEMGKPTAPSKLKEMMDAGRFVYIQVPFPAAGSPRGAGSPRRDASSVSSPAPTSTSGGH